MKNVLILRAIVLTLAIVAGSNAYGQRWVELMLEPGANFFEVQKAFEKEWEGKSYVKGKGYKQYKRWEHFWEMRINPDGSFPKYTDMLSSYNTYIEAYPDVNRSSSLAAGDWSPLGPFSYTNTDSWSAGLGRVNMVIEDPNDPNTIYIGAPAGGIWKSTDAGSTWTPLIDDLAAIGVSWITIDPNNSNNIYIATGDADGGDTYSIGVWRSIDGGTTWNPTGSIFGGTNKVLIDPQNSNILWCATTGGLYKTIDAGATWNLSINGHFDDIEFKPGNSQVVYGVTSDHFFRTNDGGTNWTQTTSGLPWNSGRLKVAVTPAEPTYVYIISANDQWGFQGVYRSTDSGLSFATQNTTAGIFDGSTQAWFDLDINVSPTNADEVMMGVLNVHKSSNGGVNWTQVNSWSSPGSAAYTHGDIHYVGWYGNNCYVGSDGGVSVSTNFGNSFTDLSDNLQIGQFYTIAGTEQDPNIIAGGLQDNGGYAYVNGTWRVYYGADGMESAIDPNNSQRIYGMIQYGSLYRSSNQALSSSGQGSPEQGAWVTPMQFDPNVTGTRILVGYNDVWEYTGGGNAWNQISSFNFPGTIRTIEIFPGNSDIFYAGTVGGLYKTANDGGSFTNVTNFSTGSGITSVETHPTDPNTIWTTSGGTGIGQGKVHVSRDGGLTWTNITGNLPNVNVNIIKHEEGSDEGLYIGTDIGVYYTDSILGAWIPFNLNLPNTIVNDLEIHHGSGLVRAGTYGRGVWESDVFTPPSVNDDAGIQAVSNPQGLMCGVLFEPVVTLRNYGTNTLSSVNINYDVDGANSQVFAWTGSLAPGASEQVTLPTVTVIGGVHTFNAFTSDPNGVADAYSLNDPSFSGFSVDLTGNPVVVNLTTDCFGAQTTWEVQDDQGATLYSEGPYQNIVGGESISMEYCLDDGCYQVQVFDSNGDGMNGSTQGGCAVDGDVVIEDRDGNTLAQLSSPAFGSDEVMPFCVANPLIANFTTSKFTVCSNTPVNFTDLSAGSPNSWQWSFAGGTPATATTANTITQYANTGVYDVQLIVSNGIDFDTLLIPNYITVVSSPVPTISITDETCAGDCDGEVSVTVAGGTPPFSYVWSNGLGHGEFITNVCAGFYPLVVTDDNGCVASGISATIEEGIEVTPSFTPSAYTVYLNQGATVDFTNTSIHDFSTVTCDWDFGDTNTSNIENPSHSYTAVGSYTVTLTLTDSTGTCLNSSDLQIEVKLNDAIDEHFDWGNNVVVFPNPGQGEMNINLSEAVSENIDIKVFNNVGQLVKTEQIPAGQTRLGISMDGEASGLYRVTFTAGNQQWSVAWELMR